MKKSIIIACLILAVLISGCTQKTETKPETTNAVEIKDFAFTPDSITVSKGTTVTWTNKDSASHTVASINKKFVSGTLGQGETYSYTFNDAGTFEYQCGLHPSMRGKVFVS